MNRQFSPAKLLSALLVAALSQSAVAAVLEEVVVTAQFRAESLQDVPVSVSAMQGDKLMEAGIDKIEDLQAYVPNLSMSETGIGTNIYVRGIGSGINQGFEQSVGMYFDGVSYGRAQLSRSPFMDLARVEVLRGPQNILYGKSSIAGALNLISARPTEELETGISLSMEPEYNTNVLDLVLSGPLTDNLAARVAARFKEDDGYIENLTSGKNEPNREEQTVRLMLEWDITPDLVGVFKIEQSSFDVVGRQVEIINDQPSVSTNPLFAGRTYAQILDSTPAPGQPGAGAISNSDSSVQNNSLDYKRSSNRDFSENTVEAYIAKFEFPLGDSEHMITATSAYLTYEFEEICDCDFTGAEVFQVALAEEYSQFSQEIRWVSPVGEDWEFIGGGYFQTSDLEFFDSILVTGTLLPTLLNAADAAGSGACLAATSRQNDCSGDETGVAGNAGSTIAGLGTPRDFTTEADLYTIFLQSTWNMSESLRLTLGGRLQYEKKEGSRSIDFIDLATGASKTQSQTTPDDGTANSAEVDTVVARNFLAERHQLGGERSETKFSPLITLQWNAFEETMFYMTLTQGSKAGGYDARSNGSPESNQIRPVFNPNITPFVNGTFEFEEELSTSFEVGSKSTFLDGALEFNAAFFLTKYDDLQVSVFDGTLGFNVGNAGKATTMGLEIDGRYAISDYLTLSYALALLDFEFDEFEDGQCYQDRVNAGNGLSSNAPPPDRKDENGVPFCDYKGESNQYAADYSGNMVLSYNRDFGGSYEFRGNLDFVFTDDYNPTQNLDPNLEQDGYVKVNARLAIANLDQGWEVAIVGKNLTDEETVTYANDTPLANSIFGSVNHYGFIAPPRTVGLQVGWRFQ